MISMGYLDEASFFVQQSSRQLGPTKIPPEQDKMVFFLVCFVFFWGWLIMLLQRFTIWSAVQKRMGDLNQIHVFFLHISSISGWGGALRFFDVET